MWYEDFSNRLASWNLSPKCNKITKLNQGLLLKVMNNSLPNNIVKITIMILPNI